MTTAKLVLTAFVGHADGDDGSEAFDMVIDGEIEVSYEADSEALHFISKWDNGKGHKKRLSITIDGMDEVDALSRYLQMIVEQANKLAGDVEP